MNGTIVLAGRRLGKWRSISLGVACLGLGAIGLSTGGAGASPTIPIALAAVVLLRFALRSPRRPLGSDPACPDDACDTPMPVPAILADGRIEVGKPFPPLTLPAHDGTSLEVPAGLLGRASVLYFMRAQGCSICRRHVRAFASIGDPGLDVVIVHPGDDGASKALAGAFDSPFRFASGRDSGAYSLLMHPDRSFGLARRSGTVLVDDLGIVRYARLSILPFNAFSEPELREARRQLDEATGSPRLGFSRA